MIAYQNGDIYEQVKKIPLMGEYDAVVVGGGVAGFGAAVAIGKRGRKVLLIEATSALGGLVTMGLVNIPAGLRVRHRVRNDDRAGEN